MRRFSPRRPSPALAISLVALFVALGGSAYALTITGSDVVNGSLTGEDIRNRSLTQLDLRGRALKGTLMQKDSVGYNAVKEQVLDASKLKQVNSSKDSDGLAGVAGTRIEPFFLENAQTRGLGTVGPFTLTAHCATDGPDQVASITVQTNQNDSAVDAVTEDADFDIGESATLTVARAPLETPAFSQSAAGAVVAPNGTEILGQDLYAGTSLLGQPSRCHFGGLLLTD